MKLNNRRSNIEIIADMLRVGKNGAGKTEIMYSTNMSFTQIQKYLNFLMVRGFITKIEVGKSVITYQVTESGAKLLKSIEDITDMLGFDSET